MDLARIKIHLRIKLDKISAQYEPGLKKAFQNFGEVCLEISFFRAEQFRVLKKGDNEKISVVSGIIGDWLESYFGSICSPEYCRKVATVCALWCLPGLEIDGDIFRNRGFLNALGFMADDLADGDVIIPEGEGFEPVTMRQFLQKGIKLSIKLGYDSGMWEGLAKAGGSFSKVFSGAIHDGINKLDFDDKTIRQVMLVLLPVMQADKWLSENEVAVAQKLGQGEEGKSSPCSLNTVRAFREMDSGTSAGAELWYTTDYEPIPEHLRRHPALVIFNGLADRIGGCLNDIFGFMKDVRNGCLDGIIMYRIQRGVNPIDAVKEEAVILVEAVQDYLILRRTLIKEKKELMEYVKMVDSQIYGWLQAFVNSDRYGLKGFMEIELNLNKL